MKLKGNPTREFGIEELRHLVGNFDACNETFNQRWTVDQLIVIHRMWIESGWDIFPDQWTERQLREALRGIPPNWDPDTERPTYGSRKAR